MVPYVYIFLVICIFQVLFSSVCVGSLDLLVTLCEVICITLSAILFPIASFEYVFKVSVPDFFCFQDLITKVKFIRSSNSGGLACYSLK